jgi:hypothetical protein
LLMSKGRAVHKYPVNCVAPSRHPDHRTLAVTSAEASRERLRADGITPLLYRVSQSVGPWRSLTFNVDQPRFCEPPPGPAHAQAGLLSSCWLSAFYPATCCGFHQRRQSV